MLLKTTLYCRVARSRNVVKEVHTTVIYLRSARLVRVSVAAACSVAIAFAERAAIRYKVLAYNKRTCLETVTAGVRCIFDPDTPSRMVYDKPCVQVGQKYFFIGRHARTVALTATAP